ncbi:class A sortase [uncultured Tissierella sp.]|uniref:class A sortase n=1 Tax=uncultured Tissierella sp. TaxID=448160 RepID=UPI002803F5E6|nr:class A sortase [uncultured Tissierella sp.]MDU5080693.1 class A sortase [Bacillota bacterium]
MKKFISIVLIIIGIALILTPTIKNQIIKHNIKKKSEIVNTISHEEITENIETDAEFDYEAIEDVGITSTIIGSINFDNKSMIGQLIIPELDINLPVLKGVTNANLLAGATTMVPEQKMGEGNYPLAGHRMKQKDLLFGSLMDIEVGTTVYITDKKTIYEYKIYNTVVVPDTAMEMLDNKRSEEQGRPIISLMTCYYSSKTGKRFFALGELVDEYPVED